MSRFGTGAYYADIPGLSPGSSVAPSNALVVAYGDGPERCALGGWMSSPAVDGTRVFVNCSDPGGNPADARFVLSYGDGAR